MHILSPRNTDYPLCFVSISAFESLSLSYSFVNLLKKDFIESNLRIL